MTNLAEHRASVSPFATDPVIAARADAVRAMIKAIPRDQLMAVLWEARDVFPPSVLEKLQPPKRGGDVLHNVFELFKSEPNVKRAAPDVVDALAKRGKTVEATPVRQALNYLNSRRILRRVGYGLYQLEDGRIVDTPFA
jgi:hypothetical protein